MPPKGRKSVSAWNVCEECKVVVSQKDLVIHAENSCPPPNSSWTHGYIRNGILFGFLEEINNRDGLKNLPNSVCDDLVLISQSALQLCNIAIGDPVVVDICGTSTVKTAWTNLEKSLKLLIFDRKILRILDQIEELITVGESKQMMMIKLRLIMCEKNNDSFCKAFLNQIFVEMHRDKIFKPGDRLHLQYYGRDIFFNVSEILPFKESYLHKDFPEIIKGFEELTIETPEDEDIYYRVVEETRWNIKTVNSSSEEENSTERPLNRLSTIGGLDNVIEEVRKIIEVALTNTELITMRFNLWRGILLYGPTGSGKTMLAEALAAESNVNIVRVNGCEIYSKYLGETDARLRDLFKTAEQKAPSIILMEEVDSLCPKRGNDGSGGSEQDKRVVATLSMLLDALHYTSGTSCKAIAVIATTSKPDAIDPALRRPGRLDVEIEIGVPSPEARLEILQKLIHGTQFQVTDEELRDVAFSAHGFVGADLASLCSHAYKHAASTSQATITIDDFAWALTQVKPSAMREVLIEVPNVQWSDIGGQHDLKLKLRQAIEWPLKHPEAFVRMGITPPKGVLMYGPPGCSKTMIAKALATESKLNFLSIKGPEIFSKWLGDSEKAVKEIFRKARQVAPSIIFFDELDALGGERSGAGDSGSSHVQDRVLLQLVLELDGSVPLGNVMVVGATNRPDRMDPALLRRGRFDRLVYVPLPDAETRREILEIKLRKIPKASDVDIDYLVSKTEKYSGAEVVAVCHEAAMIALKENINTNCVSQNHFITALQLVTPRTPQSLLQLYEDYQQTK
ncbi:hypothetical protein L9F63_024266 [Diploptera punctata]|uniref:AAA+ ATPase domain-containing protein n=1 Tax=Diploptera punctata TaxID=6984 RepID=A0AAD8E7V9_DIPPU|nr:hypothetical protein L9F63_024266 [Diploptera punctata]